MKTFTAVVSYVTVNETQPNGTARSITRREQALEVEAESRVEAWAKVGWPTGARGVQLYEGSVLLSELPWATVAL